MALSGKKSILTIQLNWIFVFIAGAVILAFFIAVMNNYNQNQEKNFAVKLSQNINSQLLAARSASGIYKQPEIIKSRIDFICDEGYSALSVSQPGTKNSLWSRSLDSFSLFSPETLEGQKLYTFALDWNVPFTVTPLVYATNENVKYFIYDDDSGYGDILYEMMPSVVAKQMIVGGTTPTTIIDASGFDLYVFVFFKSSSTTVPNVVTTLTRRPTGFDAKVVGVSFSNFNDLGTLTFYDYTANPTNPQSEQSSSFGKEMVLAAVFSADKDLYECNMQKALQRYDMVRKLSSMRIAELTATGSAVSQFCKSLLISARSVYEMSSLTGKTFEEALGIISTRSLSLKAYNDDLSRKSCPLLY